MDGAPHYKCFYVNLGYQGEALDRELPKSVKDLLGHGVKSYEKKKLVHKAHHSVPINAQQGESIKIGDRVHHRGEVSEESAKSLTESPLGV